MAHQSGGTVTFLFTDVEGSTGLWEEHPAAMQLAIARHDALLSEAIEKHNGAVFKTMGDACCAAFATAPEALTAALSAQRALLTEPWEAGLSLRVRMALYTGEAERRNNDYFGQPLNRVARLLAIGYGGQVLVSEGTRALVQDFLPAPMSLRDLGMHRLRDLTRLEHVFQLVHPDLPFEFPSLRSLPNPTALNNLPHPLTSFIGREKEMAEVRALLTRSRLLTLTGAGGCGKTRLSLQLAASLLEEEGDGAWLVELAPLTDPLFVPQTVARALGVREEPGRPLTESLIQHLKARQILLVLDNCEHLLLACAQLAEALLRFCGEVKILASSREPLGIPGETTYRIPSLSFPDLKQNTTVEDLDRYEAVRLFLDRAETVVPGFTVTAANARAIAQICSRLDGIPLAIELAAARVRTLAVQEIDARLDNRFRLLIGGGQTALPRQQTLRALIDWSYDMLDAQERLLLHRLSVFAGGWTIEAAEHVCAGGGVNDWEVLDVLTRLVNKSLVVAELQEGHTRYRLLETVRQYSHEKLSEAGPEGPDAVHRRHCDYYVHVAEEAEPHLRDRQQLQWLALLETENDNLRAAQEWALTSHAEAALRIAGALWWFWFLHGHWMEGQQRPTAALSRADSSPFARARLRALIGASLCLYGLGDYAALRDPATEGVALAREVGDRWLLSLSLQMAAVEAVCSFDVERAEAAGKESLALARELGEKWLLSWALLINGNLECARGNYEHAYGLFTEGIAPAEEAGDRWVIGYMVGTLAHLELERGEDEQAEQHYRRCLLVIRELGQPAGIILGLQGLAGVAGKRRQPQRAARLLGAVEVLREEYHYPVEARDRPSYDRKVAAARAQLSEEAFAAAWAEGGAMTLDQAIAYALD